MLNEKSSHRHRGATMGFLTVLLLALCVSGHRLSLASSASTGSIKPSASPSTAVLAPAAKDTGGGSDNCVDPSSGAGNCEHRFGVSVGQTQTLYPGLTRALPVTYSNPNSFDILIKTYRVSVSVPSARAIACPASSLQVPSGTVTPNPKPTVARNGSTATTVPIGLLANAPEGCQQVAFTITVDATAVKK